MSPYKAGSSSQTRKPKRPNVTRPTPIAPSIGLPSSRGLRSLPVRLRKMDALNDKRFRKYVEQVTKIQLPFTLDSLKTNKRKEEMERICQEDLGPNQPAQCMSAQFVDSQGEPVLFYFGQRILLPESMSAPLIPLRNQYIGRTERDLKNRLDDDPTIKIINDGLSSVKEALCKSYQLATQSLCSDVPLLTRQDRTRHDGANVMKYSTESGSIDKGKGKQVATNEEEDEDAYELEDLQNTGIVKDEQAGVLHLVQGWIQQGQAKKGLYISGDISHSSTTLAAAGSYLHLTQAVAGTLSAMFHAVFPEWHDKYSQAFKAGKWLRDDPGPFLGRAVIYKLQGKVHKDRCDMGPSASFGVGLYSGGEMLFPQLGTKLEYKPGHVCIFYSSKILHKVARFVPLCQTQAQEEENVTPGRIGSVFFFPAPSYNILDGKWKDWAYQTAFGRNEGLMEQLRDRGSHF